MNKQLSVTITGQILKIEEPQNFGSGTFRKASCTIEVENGKYPQRFTVDAVGKSADLYKDARAGDTVTLQCNLTGREHNGRCYTSLAAWRIESESANDAPQDTTHHRAESNQAVLPNVDTDDDGIPF